MHLEGPMKKNKEMKDKKNLHKNAPRALQVHKCRNEDLLHVFWPFPHFLISFFLVMLAKSCCFSERDFFCHFLCCGLFSMSIPRFTCEINYFRDYLTEFIQNNTCNGDFFKKLQKLEFTETTKKLYEILSTKTSCEDKTFETR